MAVALGIVSTLLFCTMLLLLIIINAFVTALKVEKDLRKEIQILKEVKADDSI